MNVLKELADIAQRTLGEIEVLWTEIENQQDEYQVYLDKEKFFNVGFDPIVDSLIEIVKINGEQHEV